MSWGAIVVGVVGAGVSLYNASKNRETAEGIAADAEAQREQEQAKLDKQIQAYKSMKIENPYKNMENTFEDLTVNQQQAQFQTQQAAQQRANIMQNLRGAAGGSGIAALAQSLANQGALQTQRISASIGQQEARNQALAAKGAAAVNMAERQGDQWVQQAQMDRQATILGMQMGTATGANMAAQQSQMNQMNAQVAQQQSTANLIGTLGTAAGQIDWGGSARQSDPNLPQGHYEDIDPSTGSPYTSYQDWLNR